MKITCEQMKEARGLLGWSRMKLAVRSGVGIHRIKLTETGKRFVSQMEFDKVCAALESAGIEFIADNDARLGVRMKAASPVISDEAALPDIPDDAKRDCRTSV